MSAERRPNFCIGCGAPDPTLYDALEDKDLYKCRVCKVIFFLGPPREFCLNGHPIRVLVDESIPKGTVEFLQGNKIVGRIIGLKSEN